MPISLEAGLAWAVMRHRPGRWLLLALGVALAAFLPVVSSGLRTEAAVAAVRSAVDALPEAQRAVLAVTSRSLQGTELAQADRSVRYGFGSAGLTSVQQLLTFRPLAVAGTDVTLGAADALRSDVHLTSGRLPQRCRPTRCEVLSVRMTNGQTPPVDLPSLTRGARKLGLVVTGSAELVDQRLIGLRLAAADLPMLLGQDPAELARLASLDLFGRNTAWFGTLDGGTIAAQGVPRFTRTLADVADQVNADSGPLSVVWPVDPITEAGGRADASADRFAVLGAGAGALQLGFCLMAAAGMRRRQQLTGRLLSRRGGSPGQLLLTLAIQPLLAVIVGLLVGVCSATLVVGVRAESVVRDPWPTALRAVGTSWPTLAVLAAAAVLITVAVARWPQSAGRGTQLVLDVVLVAAIGVTVLLLVGAGGGVASPFAPSVVVLVATATGLVAARLWAPFIALTARWGSNGPVRLVALVGARRRPLMAMVTAGFLAAACCSLVFAGAYRSSLRQSAADQAAAQVPLDVRVGPSAQVSVPLDVLDAPKLTSTAPGVAIHPVVSSPVTAFAGSSLATALPLTGIDPQLLTGVHEFAATTGSTMSPADLAAKLTVAQSPGGAAPELPAGTVEIGLQVTGMNPDITVSLWLSTPEGREQHLELTGSGPHLKARLSRPAQPADGQVGSFTVQAVEIAESASHLMHRQHAVGEGSTDRALASGDLTLATVSADGRPVDWSWASWGSDQAQLKSPGNRSLAIHYQLGDARVVLTPGFQPRSSLSPLPVAVDEDTAARAGPTWEFGITVNGLTVPVRIVAVLPRMPALDPTFLLADRSAVTALLDRSAPGTASVSQVWIAAPEASLAALRSALESSSAATATLSYRSEVAASINADPVATRSIQLLAIAGSIALLLAMVSVATAVRSDLEESATDHLALELDGWPTRQLRVVLLLRWLSVLAVGIPVGVAGGFGLAATAVRILVTGPGGTAVVPPLRLLLATPSTAVVVGAAVLGGLSACSLGSLTAFRERLPSSPELDL